MPKTRPSRRRQLFNQLLETAQKLPGADVVQARAEQAERLLVKELKSRLDRITDEERMLPEHDRAPGQTQMLRRRMAQLMDRNSDQSRDEALAELCARLLDTMLPDEARILAALSDGESHPVVHVGVGPKVGRVSEYLLRNVSAIGKQARVRLLDQVPVYLTRLAQLGLIETGPEDSALDLKYQILESDKLVRMASARADADWTQSVRTVRRTVAISAFGRQFWELVGPN